MLPPAGRLASVICAFPAAGPIRAEDATRDLTAHLPGHRSTFVLRDVAAGLTVRHGRPMAEQALAALGVLPGAEPAEGDRTTEGRE